MALLGAHMSIAGGLWKSIERGEELGCEAIQIFTRNQLQWRSDPLPDQVCDRFLRTWAKSSVRSVTAHASYLINLAGEENVRRKSILSLSDELERCGQLGIDSLVLHPGSHRGAGKERGLELVASGLEEVFKHSVETRARVLLETMAGQGDTLGDRLEDLAEIIDNVSVPDRLGVCLDTCHLFAAGYELRTKEAYERLKARFENLFDPGKPLCWHLNDSKAEKGARTDRHEHLGDGHIGVQVFSLIINDPFWEEVPCILETPKKASGDVRNLALLRKLRGK